MKKTIFIVLLSLISTVTFSQTRASDATLLPQEIQFDGMPDFQYSINGKLCCLDGRMKFNGHEISLKMNRKKTSQFFRVFEGNGYTVVFNVQKYGDCAGEGKQNISGSVTVTFQNASQSFPFKGADGFSSSKKCKIQGNG